MMRVYKIQELGKLTDTHVETIRYYEKTGLLPMPRRAANGYRLFDDQAVEMLKFIKAARAIDFSIGDIRQLLQLQQNPKGNCVEADDMAKKYLFKTEEKIKKLIEIKKILEEGLRCDRQEVAECKVLSRLSE